jgi:hypothetical protein
MSDVQGIVKRITSRQAGRGKAYNLQMDSGDWFGYGFEQPNFGEGSEVCFDVDWNGQYGNVRKGSLQVLSGGGNQGGGYQQNNGGGYQNSQGNRGGNTGGGRGGQSHGGSGSRKSGGRDQYWEDKAKRDVVVQRQIQFQASRNAAIAAVDIALKNDCLPLPQKKGDRLDAVLAVIAEVTERFNYETDCVANPGANPSGNPAEPHGVQDDMNNGYQE